MKAIPMKKSSSIYVADHEGFFGGAIVRRLKEKGYKNLILASGKKLDLKRQSETEKFFHKTKPEYVFLAAQKSGGIMANIKYPADFIYDNLTVEINVFNSAMQNGVKKLLFFGASCIYPKETRQPIKEAYLLQGPLEKTSEAYALAKLAGVGLCQAYNAQHEMASIPVVPATVYGPGASFDLENSHVIDALIRKFHEAKESANREVTIWGTGEPKREFLYIDDLADACIFLMNNYNNPELINIGSGEDISIKELAVLVKKIVGFKGQIIFDKTKPDGVRRKLLDATKARRLGWEAKIDLEVGVAKTYLWYQKNKK